MKIKILFSLTALTMALMPVLAKAEITVPMNLVNENGIGNTVGQIIISESKYGLVFTPALNGLPPGLHGFHIHQNPDCSAKEKDGKMVPALAAGGHYDPEKTNQHGFPWGGGHLGDLPPLFVDMNGNAVQPVLAPRLKIADIKGRSIIIHLGGDNHSDHPAPLGGGGIRIVCGILQ
jgi:Cu-Zn family superoxide dismutase